MSKIRTVRDADHFRDLVAAPNLTVFVFSATWCGPCNDIADDLERLATHYHPDVTFAKVDADDNEDILVKCKVAVLPTFMMVRDGVQVGFAVGADMEELKMEMQLHTLPTEPTLANK